MASKPFTISGLEALKGKLKSLTDDLKQDVGYEIKASADAIEAHALRNAPKDNGFLVQGIGKQQTGELKWEVTSNADYSAFVEFGTRSQVSIPPGLEEFAAQFKGSQGATARDAKEAIYEWCRSKGIEQEAWWPIFISIMVKGIKPHPFFFGGFLDEKPKLLARIKKIVTDKK